MDYLADVMDEIGEFEDAGDYDKAFDRNQGKKSDYEVMVLFRTKEDVFDFTILSLALTDVRADGQAVFDREEMLCIPTLKADMPLAVPMVFPGDTPTNCFSYKDGEGITRAFSVAISGFDGSLAVDEIY